MFSALMARQANPRIARNIRRFAATKWSPVYYGKLELSIFGQDDKHVLLDFPKAWGSSWGSQYRLKFVSHYVDELWMGIINQVVVQEGLVSQEADKQAITMTMESNKLTLCDHSNCNPDHCAEVVRCNEVKELAPDHCAVPHVSPHVVTVAHESSGMPETITVGLRVWGEEEVHKCRLELTDKAKLADVGGFLRPGLLSYV